MSGGSGQILGPYGDRKSAVWIALSLGRNRRDRMTDSVSKHEVRMISSKEWRSQSTEASSCPTDEALNPGARFMLNVKERVRRPDITTGNL